MTLQFPVRSVVLAVSVSLHGAGLYWLEGQFLLLSRAPETPPLIQVRMNPVSAAIQTQSLPALPVNVPVPDKVQPPRPEALPVAAKPLPVPRATPVERKPAEPKHRRRPDPKASVPVKNKPVSVRKSVIKPVAPADLPDAQTVLTPEAATETPHHLAATPSALSVPAPVTATVPVSYALGSSATPNPPYPYSARRRGLEGRVLVQIDYDAQGVVIKVTLLESSQHPILDRVALETLQAWRLTPGSRGGLPVAGKVQVPIRFALR